MTNMNPVLMVHGGAGRIREEVRIAHEEGLREALKAGWSILAHGGSAMDAVVEAVRVMEDLPQFNAGRGSSLTRKGTVEMDAGLMDGHTLEVGAVARVSRVQNPIVLAHRVMVASPHIFLVDSGAEAFAQAQGIPLINPEQLITEDRRERLQRWLAEHAHEVSDTVGAVALDARGHMAAATSTGGMMGKLPGRVGDSPLVGCGFYAEDGLGACSATGVGEAIARVLLSYRAVAALATTPSPQEAAQQAISLLAQRTRSQAGIILLSQDGQVAAAWNSPNMSWGYHTVEEMMVRT